MAKNAVLGLVENYGVKEISPFVDSLRTTGYSGDIVFFVRNLSDETLIYLSQKDVKVIKYNRLQFRGIWKVRLWTNYLIAFYRLFFKEGKFPFQEWFIKSIWHVQANRYYQYLNYLENGPEYSRIMLCDVRDVIFQRDPFDYDADEGVLVFEEFPDITISKQPHNRMWIEELFGTDELKRIGDRPVVCSGVSVGTYNGMKAYLREMNRTIALKHGCENGFDQGVHNYLIYNDMIENLKIFKFGHGPVWHVGIAPGEEISISDKSEVINKDGDVCNVVHQYDRHEMVANALKAGVLSQ